jgi:hypothetical protein
MKRSLETSLNCGRTELRLTANEHKHLMNQKNVILTAIWVTSYLFNYL